MGAKAMSDIKTSIQIKIDSTDSESDTRELARLLDQSDFRFEISYESLAQLRGVSETVITMALSTSAVLALAPVLLSWLKSRKDKPEVTLTTQSAKFVLGKGADEVRLIDSLRQIVEKKHDSQRPPKDWD